MSATLTPSMSTVLSAAILAMDAYNRGYNPGIFNLPDASGTGLGDATIGIEDGDNDPIAKSDGFYAISYTIGSTLVISYRGTDNLNPFDSANDIINGWLSGISLPSNQSDLAATFYDSATGGGTLTSGVLPTVILVGHSLGGGLAGYIAALTGDTAFVFDSMPYGGLSILTYLAEASSQGADLISALTGDYATLPLPNGQSITAQSVSGEFLSAARPADPAIADGIGSAFYGDQAGTLISYDVAAVDGSANSPGPLNAYQDTSILNLPAAVELHSASLLVLLQYASDNNFQTWESIGAQLFQAYQNSAIAAAVGLGQGVTGNASVSSQLLTEIAYSAINDGAMPFGDTGIAALFHDADSLGQFFSFTSTPSTFVTNVETDLTEVVVEYAGWLAKNVDTDSSNSSGIVTLVSQGFGLDVNLSSSAWAIDSAKYPDVVGLDDLLQNVFQQNTNYAGSIFQPNSGASPTGVTLQIGASSASLQGDSKADVFVVTGDGVTINSGSTSNDIVIAGNSATVNISPQSSDSPGTVSNTIELAGNNQTLNLNASTASSGVTIVIGQPGNNTFDIDNGFGNADDTFNNATNIIWGGGGTSTYNFLSNSYIAVYYLQDPTVQSVSDIDVAQLESLYGYGYTIIIDPTSSDRIEFRGNLLSSSSYQKIYENASANYDFKYYGYPAGIQSSDGNQFYYEEHFGNEGDYLEVKDSTSFQYVPDGNIQFLDISHFINGDFGITLFGDGPDETENGSSSGYPNATDSGFFSYNQKHYVSTTGLQDYADSSGSGPNDNFDFGQGEGQLDITETDTDSSDTNTLTLDIDELTVSQDGSGNLYLTDGTAGDVVKLAGMANGTGGVQLIKLSGGTTLTAAQLIALEASNTTGNTIFGNSGPDTLYGRSGKNIFDGEGASPGSEDYEQGDGGADTFIYNQGYGQLEISEDAGYSQASSAVLQLGPGIFESKLIITEDNQGDAIVSDGTAGDAIKIDRQFDEGSSGTLEYGVGSIRLADGSVIPSSNFLTLNASQNNTLVASQGDSTITVTGNSYLLEGGSVDAVLNATGNQNTLAGGSGSDMLTATGNNNLFTGAGGNEQVNVTGNSNTIQAGASSISVTLSGNDNQFVGGSGTADVVVGSGSGNTFSASTGSVTLDYSNDPAAVTVNLGAGTASFAGTTGIDVLSGISQVTIASNSAVEGGTGPVNLLLVGNGSTLQGGSGFATMTSYGDGDTLVGGSGGGSLSANGSGNQAEGGPGTTTDVISGNYNTWQGGSGTANLTVYGNQNTLVAGTGDEQVSLNGNSNVVEGGSGDDEITLAGNSTTFTGGTGSGNVAVAGNDNTLNAGSSDLSFVVQSGSGNTFSAGEGSATLDYSNDAVAVSVNLAVGTATSAGLSGVDVIQGISQVTIGSNSAAIAGPSGADLLINGDGSTLTGGRGDDTLNADGNANTLIAGSGTAALSVSGNSSLLEGGAGSDTLVSIGQSDTVATGNGDDQLSVYGDANFIQSGAGTVNATLTGDDNQFAGGSGYTSIAVAGNDNTFVGGSGSVNYQALSGGGNTYSGGSGSASIDYTGFTSAVSVNLVSGRAIFADGSGQDTLLAISQVTIASNSSVLAGAAPTNLVLFGNDSTLQGGSGSATMTSYGDDNTLAAGSGGGYITASGSSNLLEGGSGSSTLIAIGDGNTLQGGTGNVDITTYGDDETLTLGSGGGTLDLNGSGNTISQGLGTADITLSGDNTRFTGNGPANISVDGSGNVLVDGTNTNFLAQGGSGNTFSGGLGTALLDYSQDASPVNVNLATGSATFGGGGSDTLHDISSVTIGSTSSAIAGPTAATLLINGNDSSLQGASGSVDMQAYGNNDTLTAGSGSASLSAVGNSNLLQGGSAESDFVVVGNSSTLKAGAGVANMTVYGNSDTLVAGPAGGTLNVSGTSDTYVIGNNDKNITIVNGSSGNTATNQLSFSSGASTEQLWLTQSGSDLDIEVLGNPNLIDVQNWFAGPSNQVQTIISSDGLELDAGVSQLVQAMATYAGNNPSFNPATASVLPNDPTLQSALTAAWHH